MHRSKQTAAQCRNKELLNMGSEVIIGMASIFTAGITIAIGAVGPRAPLDDVI